MPKKAWQEQPARSDSDSDGILDGVELVNGTDPNKSDSDADGFSDGVEFAGARMP